MNNISITGINEKNKFLLEFLDRSEIKFLEDLSKKMIEIPSAEFKELNKMALDYFKYNSDNGVEPEICDTLEEYINREDEKGLVPLHYYKDVQ